MVNYSSIGYVQALHPAICYRERQSILERFDRRSIPYLEWYNLGEATEPTPETSQASVFVVALDDVHGPAGLKRGICAWLRIV